jgi:hypothetical protein
VPVKRFPTKTCLSKVPLETEVVFAGIVGVKGHHPFSITPIFLNMNNLWAVGAVHPATRCLFLGQGGTRVN